MRELVLTSVSAEATEAIAAAVADTLAAGDLILLFGELGAGKTTFTRGLVRGLGHPDPREVASPTFALHHRYEGGRLPVNHLDLYRIEEGLGAARQGVLDPLDDRGAVTMVEWAERLGGTPPADALRVRFGLVDATTRRISFGSGGPMLRRLEASLPRGLLREGP